MNLQEIRKIVRQELLRESKPKKSDLKNDDNFNNFIEEIMHYQSNHYGTYNRQHLVNAYKKLSSEIRDYIRPRNTNNLFRGADGVSHREAISFSNKDTASFFGAYLIPFTEIKSHEGLIDTKKLAQLSLLIGDDEGEVIVISPEWKSKIDDRLEDYRINKEYY